MDPREPKVTTATTANQVRTDIAMRALRGAVERAASLSAAEVAARAVTAAHADEIRAHQANRANSVPLVVVAGPLPAAMAIKMAVPVKLIRAPHPSSAARASAVEPALHPPMDGAEAMPPVAGRANMGTAEAVVGAEAGKVVPYASTVPARAAEAAAGADAAGAEVVAAVAAGARLVFSQSAA